MKSLFSCLLVALFVTPFCFGQQTYTNSQQNFSMNLPGTADASDSTSDMFIMSWFTSDYSLAVIVMSPADKVENTRESLDAHIAMIKDAESNSISNCQNNTFNGDYATICDWTFTNDKGVHVIGKYWMCIHNSYVYDVGVGASTESQYASQVMSYLNSFVFLK